MNHHTKRLSKYPMVCSAHVITWEWQWPTKFALLPLSQFMHANIEKKNMHVDFIATHKFLVCIELKMPHATFCMQPVNMNLHRVHLTNSSTNFSKNESYVDDAMILNLSTWLNLCSRIYVPKVGSSYTYIFQYYTRHKTPQSVPASRTLVVLAYLRLSAELLSYLCWALCRPVFVRVTQTPPH